jgi:hypothetical protein
MPPQMLAMLQYILGQGGGGNGLWGRGGGYAGSGGFGMFGAGPSVSTPLPGNYGGDTPSVSTPFPGNYGGDTPSVSTPFPGNYGGMKPGGSPINEMPWISDGREPMPWNQGGMKPGGSPINEMPWISGGMKPGGYPINEMPQIMPNTPWQPTVPRFGRMLPPGLPPGRIGNPMPPRQPGIYGGMKPGGRPIGGMLQVTPNSGREPMPWNPGGMKPGGRPIGGMLQVTPNSGREPMPGNPPQGGGQMSLFGSAVAPRPSAVKRPAPRVM